MNVSKLVCAVGTLLAASVFAGDEIVLNGFRGAMNNIAGDVSVSKEGPGTYTIGGDLTFSGTLTAKAGTLKVEVPEPEQPALKNYKWFRFSIADTSAHTAYIRLRQIGLYDADGNRQNGTMEAIDGYNTRNTTNLLSNLAVPGPNQVNYDKSMEGTWLKVMDDASGNPSDGLRASFSENGYATAPCWHISLWTKNGNGTILNLNPANPKTWIKIVMHLADDAKPIRRFDIQRMSNDGSLAPTRMMMEGSLDGQHWDVVWSNVDAIGHPTPIAMKGSSYNLWMSNGDVGQTYPKRPFGKGYELSYEANLFSWYRISFAKLGNSASGNYQMAIREVCLFDKDGNRRNGYLNALLGDTPTRDLHAAFIPEYIGVNEVGYDPLAVGKTVEVPTDQTTYGSSEFQACFNNRFKSITGVETAYRLYWRWEGRTGNEARCFPTPTDETTWIPLVMHLIEPVEITHFDVQGFGKGDGNDGFRSTWPSRILLEGSLDGMNWVTVFDNVNPGADPEFDYSQRGGNEFTGTKHNMCNMWLSDGCSAIGTEANPPIDVDADRHRILGEGWQLKRTKFEFATYNQLKQVKSIEVKNGATISATRPLAVSSLRVDGADAGTLDNFVFSEQGTIDVCNAMPGTTLPIAFSNCSGLDNLAKWNVSYNGVPDRSKKIVVQGGCLVFQLKDGLMLIFR